MRISRTALVGLAVGTLLLGATALSVSAEEPTATPTPAAQQPAQRGPFGGMLGGWMGARMMEGADWSMPGAAAKLTGLSVTEVMTMRHEGKSFAQIVESKGKTAAQLKEAVLAAHKTRLDEAVAAKRLTQAQADAAYKQMSDNVDAMITSTAAMPGGAGVGPMGGRGMMGGAGCWDGTAAPDASSGQQRQPGARMGRGMGVWQ